MGLSQQEYWSGLPYAPPGDLPGPGIESVSPALAGGFFTLEPLGSYIYRITESLCCITETNIVQQSYFN